MTVIAFNRKICVSRMAPLFSRWWKAFTEHRTVTYHRVSDNIWFVWIGPWSVDCQPFHSDESRKQYGLSGELRDRPYRTHQDPHWRPR